MSRVLVNIRGCNGAGKSTIPLSMLDDPKLSESYIYSSDAKRIATITVFPTYGWVALGKYSNKCGGLDTIKSIDIVKRALQYALISFPKYDIIMEGILCSTTYSSYADMFRWVEEKYSVQPIILSLMPPVEVCLARIQERNGGKPIKENLVADKWGMVYRSHQKFKAAGFTTVRVNTERISKDKMKMAFFKTIEKYRRTYDQT